MDDCLSKTSFKQAPRLLDDDDPEPEPAPVLVLEPNDPEWAGDTLLAELVTGELEPLDEPDRLPARSRSSA